MKNIRSRKLNRLKGYNYSQNGWYFVTICTKGREQFLGKILNRKMRLSEIGALAEKCWREIPLHFSDVKLDEFVIMPNHIHGIIIIENPNNVGNNNYCSLQTNIAWQTKWARSLSSIIRGFKIGVTQWCRENNHQYFTWQKSFYDHIIRDEKSLNEIREYIANNLLKWESDRNNLGNLWM